MIADECNLKSDNKNIPEEQCPKLDMKRYRFDWFKRENKMVYLRKN